MGFVDFCLAGKKSILVFGLLKTSFSLARLFLILHFVPLDKINDFFFLLFELPL